MLYDSQTVFALATPPGKAALAVVRISGSKAHTAVKQLLKDQTLPKTRIASLRRLYSSGDNSLIDQAVITIFTAPASFTGEDCAEISLHGGNNIVRTLLENLSAFSNLRQALPGEFTRRAVINGKLDLLQAEAIADLIAAETTEQRKQALQQLGGSFSVHYKNWSATLMKLLAYAEAGLDFSDERDVKDQEPHSFVPEVSKLIREISEFLLDNRRGERIRNGFHIAILGAPNTGKSSLINKIAGRKVAIVSEYAGTTRDVIELQIDLNGFAVTFSDTAGLREASDPIEHEGIEAAKQRAQEADLKLLVFDATQLPEIDKETFNLIDDDSILVVNKIDRVCPGRLKEIAGRRFFSIAALSGAGISDLLNAVSEEIAKRYGHKDFATITRQRHRNALVQCLHCLRQAEKAVLPELVAEDLRMGLRALTNLTGGFDIEDLLEIIFQDFCIGK
jgi:tRNA modification GTPase